ncbi:uncharacterized protein LOC144137555 [Haemaphysalis longicornis]
MAVVTYTGPAGHPCSRSLVENVDFVCKSTPKDRQLQYSQEDMSEFFTYSSGKTNHTLVFESPRSLSDKVAKYRSLTDGWAFFDVQRDVYWPCTPGAQRYARTKEGRRALRRP